MSSQSTSRNPEIPRAKCIIKNPLYMSFRERGSRSFVKKYNRLFVCELSCRRLVFVVQLSCRWIFFVCQFLSASWLSVSCLSVITNTTPFHLCQPSLTLKWALVQENLSTVFANIKGANQPAHPRSLISAFVIRLLESNISKLSTSELSTI